MAKKQKSASDEVKLIGGSSEIVKVIGTGKGKFLKIGVEFEVSSAHAEVLIKKGVVTLK